MKKTVAILLILTMALALCGCAESLQQIEIPPFPEVTPTPEPVSPTETIIAPADETQQPEAEAETAAPETEAPAAEESALRVVVGKNIVSTQDFDPAEQTELILNYSYDVIRVACEERQEVCSRINETLATIEETFYTGNQYGLDLQFLGYNTILEQAEDNYSYVKEYQVDGLSLEFSDSLSGKVTRADGAVLSVLYSNSSFTGGAHGSFGQFAYTFDMHTGEILTLDRLSQDKTGLTNVLVQQMLALVEQDSNGYYSERIDQSFLPEGGLEAALRALVREGSWYFDRDGMVLFSTLYELGPYAAGIAEFHIPYSALQGTLNDSLLFPAGRSGKGKLDVAAMEELNGGEKEIVDKITVNQGAQNLCIVVDGRIYDVAVSTVYYVDRFYENTQLWYASELSDCALQLEVEIPDGLPNLLITYYTADGVRHGKLLSQSGADGSYLLVDDDIEAVG